MTKQDGIFEAVVDGVQVSVFYSWTKQITAALAASGVDCLPYMTRKEKARLYKQVQSKPSVSGKYCYPESWGGKI
jgi:hypothetical protein